MPVTARFTPNGKSGLKGKEKISGVSIGKWNDWDIINSSQLEFEEINMRSVGIFEVKTRLSELLRSGEPIEITSHKKSVAVLYPKSVSLSSAQVKRDIQAINQADRLDNTVDMGDYV